MSRPRPDERLRVIVPEGREGEDWRDLWRHRDLLVVLAWRDVSVRYRQTAVGLAWAVIRPLATTAVFTVVFGRLAGLPSDGAPYAAMVFTGMLAWSLMAGVVTDAADSLVANANLVGKVYFPRLIVPVAAAVVALADFLVNLGTLALVLAWSGVGPSWRLALLPLAALAAAAAGLGPGLLLAALNVRYRDVRHAIPFVVQFGLYLSPVGFSGAAIPEGWRLLYHLNPAVGVIEAFRWCVLPGERAPHGPGLILGAGAIVALGWAGLAYFRRAERGFADVI